MKKLILAGLAALACIAAKPATDWTRQAAAAPPGAFVIGNPAAKTRLVEYISYTCSHCAHFTNDAAAPLKRDFIARGTTSVEVRHAVRDRLDFTATLLARCGGPSRFLKVHEAILAAQPKWMEAGGKYDAANRAAVTSAGVAVGARMLAKGSGLDALMIRQGLKPGQIDACLADAAQHKLIGEMARGAWETDAIPGTPYFLINGAPAAGVVAWAALEPRLRAAAN